MNQNDMRIAAKSLIDSINLDVLIRKTISKKNRVRPRQTQSTRESSLALLDLQSPILTPLSLKVKHPVIAVEEPVAHDANAEEARVGDYKDDLFRAAVQVLEGTAAAGEDVTLCVGVTLSRGGCLVRPEGINGGKVDPSKVGRD